jgi:hypothetical protein
MPHITDPQFRERFVALILGARDLPKKDLERHVLFLSAVLNLDPKRAYSEKELNDELRKWTDSFGAQFGLDHVTLRRFLIDERYLTRDSAGNSYERRISGLRYTFNPSLESIDLTALVDEARREREERKRRYRRAVNG